MAKIKLLFMVFASITAIISNHVLIDEASLVFHITHIVCNIALSFWLVCIIHEAAHMCTFLLLQINVTSICVGVVCVSFHNRKAEICLKNRSLFSGSCMAKRSSSCVKTIAALYAGGVSGILLAAIFLFVYLYVCEKNMRVFCMSVAVLGLTSGIYTIFFPKSADRTQIRIMSKEKAKK